MKSGGPQWAPRRVHTPDEYLLRGSGPYRERILAHYPPAVAQIFREEYLARFARAKDDMSPGGMSRIGGVNQWLVAAHVRLVAGKPQIAYESEEIERRARIASDFCSRVGFRNAVAYTIGRGVLPPAARKVTQKGIHARLSDRSWWRKALRRTHTRECENAFRAYGLVHRQGMPYVTDDGARVHKENKQRAGAMLAEMQVVNEQGELFSVADLAARSVSNPTLRRGELMCRIRGFEEIGKLAGHAAVFLTMTAPSCYHATHVSGEANDRYNGTHVYGAQAWLQKMWARARAKLARLSIYFYGFRVVEPHHDGTPHWHALFWCAKHNVELLCKVIRDHWLSEHANEPGAELHRFKRVDIDGSKGSAIGYVSKYVAKSIDGHKVGEDQDEGLATGLDSVTAAERIEAWSRIHGIRQFQQIGGPSVSVWRELRRLRGPLDETAPEELEEARQAADAGQWSEFILALGGPEYCRRGLVKLWKAPATQPNMYGEPGAERIVGVLCYQVGYRTRVHEWRRVRPCSRRRSPSTPENEVYTVVDCITRAPVGSGSDLGPVSITVRAADPLERWVVEFERATGRYPSLDESKTFQQRGKPT